jgi:multidrug efflux system membrane fusion protein
MDSQVAPNAPINLPQRSRKSKLVGSLIAIAVLAALGAYAWHLTHQAPAGGAGGAGGRGAGGAGGPGGRMAPPSTVGVATAAYADLPVTLDALGTVTPLATVTVRAQVSGILQKLLYKEGDMVKAGQVLAIIDPSQFQMALDQAVGARVRDEAQLENARLMLDRDQTLLKQDSIARQDVDTQAALVKQLQGTVQTDKAAEGTARLNLGYTKIVSPVTGRAGLRPVDVGNLVNAGDAAGLAVVTQLSPIDVVFTLPQDSVPDVQTRLHDGAALPSVAFDRNRVNTLDTGTFYALDNVIDTTTGTVKAKSRFANAKGALFANQFVNVRLELRTIKNALMVPVTAMRHGSNGDFVYVLNAAERTVSLRNVVRGGATVDKIQVTSGLQVGEQVITEGADRLKDGAKVVLPGDKPAFGGSGRRSAAGGSASGSTPADGSAPRHHRRDASAASAASADASAPAAAPARPAAGGAAQ